MFSFQACSPWLLVIIGLVLYLFGSPMQPTIAGPLNLAAESTSSQLSAVPQTLQQDLISETSEAYPNKARLSWASWMSVVCTIVAIAISFKHHRYEHLSGGLPTSQAYLVVYMHDRDGKKR